MRISDWSSDVCSSDLAEVCAVARCHKADAELARHLHGSGHGAGGDQEAEGVLPIERTGDRRALLYRELGPGIDEPEAAPLQVVRPQLQAVGGAAAQIGAPEQSEERRRGQKGTSTG